MQAIIMAGGKGVRLRPYTSVIPKPLLPIEDRPIIEIIIKQLAFHGFNKITIATGYLGELIQSYLGNGEKYGLEIEYSFEREPLGTVAPLKLIQKLESNVLVMNADLLTGLDFNNMLMTHIHQNSAISIGVYKKTIQSDYGVIESDDDDNLICIREKPKFDMAVNMGIYTISTRILDYLPFNQRVDFPDLINLLLDRQEKVRAYKFNGFWLDIGQHVDYDRAVSEYNKFKGELNIDRVETIAI